MFYVKMLCIGNSVGKVIHVFSRACVRMYILLPIVYKYDVSDRFVHVFSFFVRNLNSFVRFYYCVLILSFKFAAD